MAEVATDDATDTDIAALRAQYEALLGKKAPSAAKAATLQKAVDEALAAQQASGTAESGENAADDSGGADATGTE